MKMARSAAHSGGVMVVRNPLSNRGHSGSVGGRSSWKENLLSCFVGSFSPETPAFALARNGLHANVGELRPRRF